MPDYDVGLKERRKAVNFEPRAATQSRRALIGKDARAQRGFLDVKLCAQTHQRRIMKDCSGEVPGLRGNEWAFVASELITGSSSAGSTNFPTQALEMRCYCGICHLFLIYSSSLDTYAAFWPGGAKEFHLEGSPRR